MAFGTPYWAGEQMTQMRQCMQESERLLINRVFEKFCYIEPKASGHKKNAIVRSRQQVQELVSSK